MRKILVVLGSPRKNGCSYNIYNSLVQKLQEKKVEIELSGWFLSDQKYELCRGCSKCFADGNCIINDGFDFYETIIQYDALIMLVPSYVRQMPASLKNCFDRMAFRMHEFPLIGKKAIIVAYSVSTGEEEVSQYVSSIFKSLGCQVFASYTYNQYFDKYDILIEKICESISDMDEEMSEHKYVLLKSQEELFQFILKIVRQELEMNVVSYKQKRWKELMKYESLSEYIKHNI